MNDSTPKMTGSITARVLCHDHRSGCFLQIVLRKGFSVLLSVPENGDPPSCTIQHTDDGVLDLEQYQGEAARFRQFVEIALGPQ
jgi:hypothetical protein